jgi:hypothetical protein
LLHPDASGATLAELAPKAISSATTASMRNSDLILSFSPGPAPKGNLALSGLQNYCGP